jgi:hypothetical protein
VAPGAEEEIFILNFKNTLKSWVAKVGQTGSEENARDLLVILQNLELIIGVYHGVCS